MAPGLALGRIFARGQELQEYGGQFKALIPVKRGASFVDLNGLFDFSRIVIRFTGQDPHIVKRNTMASSDDMF